MCSPTPDRSRTCRRRGNDLPTIREAPPGAGYERPEPWIRSNRQAAIGPGVSGRPVSAFRLDRQLAQDDIRFAIYTPA